MAKYILDPSGKVKKLAGIEIIVEGERQVISPGYIDIESEEFLNKESKPSFSSFVKKIDDYRDVKSFADFENNDTTSNNKLIATSDANPNFDFVNENRENFVNYFRDFNTFKDKEVFASEFEMLGGTRKNFEVPTEYFLFMIDYFLEVISFYAVCEAFVIINGLLQDENGVEENYHLKLGRHKLVKYDVFSEYIFDVLNYPKDSREIVLGSLERITSFFLGFNEFLNPDKTIKIDEILNDTTRFKNIYDLITGDIKNNDSLNEVINFSLLQPVAIAAIVIGETLLTLNKTAEKRLLLLIRKFGFEKAWNKNLHNAKNNIDGGIENLLREMDFYRFRFAIERMHVGKKILRYHMYNATPLTHRLREAPQNRLGISKSRFKANINITSDDEQYTWDLKDSGNLNDFNSSDFAQGTRIRALPQLLNLNANYVTSLVANKEDSKDLLPVGKDLLQNFYYNKGHRIPEELAKKIENHLECEYMPFYFRDLRTNEIISFHAFLDNISDTFNPDYASTTGFGRIEEVRTYTKTTRSINLGFTVASTSQSDHDLMWYQLNKLISMCYPQWSNGVDNDYTLSDGTIIKGKYPFSQVITASPLIRLRVGDVIKSNYSKSSLSRLHGSPMSKEEVKSTVKTKSSPKKGSETEGESVYVLLPGMYRKVGIAFGFGATSYIHIKKQTIIKKDSFDITRKSINVVIVDESSQFKDKILAVDRNSIVNKQNLEKDISIGRTGTAGINHGADLSQGSMFSSNEEILRSKIGSEGIENPVVKAFESGMGRGLAGFITQLDLQYADSTWETSRIGSKAPIFLKLNISFAPIHDIAPGLDHNGMMRAPTHNVGRLNNEMYGDPYDNKSIGDGRAAANKNFKEYEKAASKG